MEPPKAPQDIELRNIIDKLAQFVARNGPDFEQMTKTKQKGNPKFAFLFGGEYYNYYQYKVTSEQSSPQQPAPPLPPAGIVQTQAFPLLTVEAITQQQAALHEQTSQSELNLNAQHLVLLQQQQLQTEEAIRKHETEVLQKEAEAVGLNFAEFDVILQPIMDTCTKDSISNGKAWILHRAVSTQINDVLATYLLYKATSTEKKFHQRLHIIYLVNDILHHCTRKHVEGFKEALEKVVVPMFGFTSLGVTEEQQGKLTKLLNIWETKNHYFSEDIVKALKDPVTSWNNYKEERLKQHREIVELFANQTKATFQGFQSQHVAFVNHTMQQIQTLEQQKQQIEAAQKQAGSTLQVAEGYPEKGFHSDVGGYPQESNYPEKTYQEHDFDKSYKERDYSSDYSDREFPEREYHEKPWDGDYEEGNDGGREKNYGDRRSGDYGDGTPYRDKSRHNYDDNKYMEKRYRGDSLDVEGPPGVDRTDAPETRLFSGGRGDDGDRRSGGSFFENGNRSEWSGGGGGGSQGGGGGGGEKRGPGGESMLTDLGINLNQPPPGFAVYTPPPNIELPDITRPPPGFPSLIQPQPEVLPEDLLPSLPYYDLPAGLMVPLIKLEDSSYKPLDPDMIRLPPPAPPSERLLAAVKSFYSQPGHDNPRDSGGWEKLGLYEYYKAKATSKKKKETDIMNGLRERSRSPTPVRSYFAGDKTPPPKRRYSSRSRSRSRERTASARRRRRERERSPRLNTAPPPSLLQMPILAPPPGHPDHTRRSPSPPNYGGIGMGLRPEMSEEKLSESNKGHQLLKKMGWSGSGLGAKEQGIADPIASADVRDKQDQYKGVGINLNDPYENFRKSKGQAFITRMKARAEERAS